MVDAKDIKTPAWVKTVAEVEKDMPLGKEMEFKAPERYTLIGVCELWGCNPQDVMFMARHGDKEDAYWQHIKTLEFVKAIVDVDEITAIDISDEDDTPAEYVYTCNNCGAHSLKGCEYIKHHKGCKPGEAAYWEKWYNDNPDEEEDS